MTEKLRGIFPALQATFDERQELDIPSMERQVAHCIEAGTHGLVFPVMGGELFYLSESERKRFVEAIVGTAAGQVPVVAGVAAPTTPIAVEHARHAKEVGADAVIALPPYITRGGTEEEFRAYYTAIAEAAELPVFIQHSWPGMSAAFMASLIRDIEYVKYIKEETSPSGHSITAALEATGPECLGVFGGAHGQWMIPEMRRGASGFIPAAQTTDIYVQVWDAFQAGDEEEARRIFNHLRPFLSLLSLIGLRLCKEVLVRRGVIRTATVRAPQTPQLDDTDRHELEVALEELEPFFLV
ncbi:MAG: dihydrodipicolinate synthase family protein [Chloroflexota bacterium]|nr:dihydrodipicolinate synthase family protein [Chloroflexota bacterium]